MADRQFVLNQTWLGQECKSVLNYICDTAAAADPQGVIDEIRSAYNTAKDVFSNTWSLDSVTVYDLDIPRPRVGVTYTFTAGPVTGTDIGITLPSQTAFLIRWIGSLAVVPNRGRTYVAGMSKDSLVGTTGLWQSTTEAAMNVLGADLINLNAGAGGTADLAIMRLGPDGTRTIANPVSSALGILVPATQRKRRLGSGS